MSQETVPPATIDPQRSGVVLIGVDDYPKESGLPKLGAVAKNRTRLAAALKDKGIWGVPNDRIDVIPNPDSQIDIVNAIADMGAVADDALVVYFAGHGQLHRTSRDLYLMLTSSKKDRPRSGVPISELHGAIKDTKVGRRVLILDCCFSGAALDQRTQAALAEEISIKASTMGLYTMTSAPKDRTSSADGEDGCTAFTGALVGVLQNGLPNEPGTKLSLSQIFNGICERLEDADPQEADHNQLGDVPFVHNRARDPQPPGSRPPSRARRILPVVVALGVGAAGPIAFQHWPRNAGGTCSDHAELLSYSDALDKDSEVKGESISGLSALALDDGRAYALADNDEPRMFPLTLGPAEDLRPVPHTAVTLRRRDDRAFEKKGFDGEALVFEKDTGTMLVASEVGPYIHRFNRTTGREIAGSRIDLRGPFRIRPNGDAPAARAIESLAVSPDGDHLYAGLESPLPEDGDARGRNLLRIQRFSGTSGGTYTPDIQYPYQTGAGLHLADMVAVDDTHLLTLERQFVDGVGNGVRVYLVTLDNSKDVTSDPSLSENSADRFIDSELLFDLAACPAGNRVPTKAVQPNPLLDNVEGMALGPEVRTGEHKGTRSLYLVSDNNESSSRQFTRLYALRVRIPEVSGADQ